MSKRPNLTGLSGRLAPKPAAAPELAPAIDTPAPSQDGAKRRGSQLDGRKGVLLRLKPKAWLQLKSMAAQMTLEREELFTMQSALEEAVNDWFKKHGEPPLA